MSEIRSTTRATSVGVCIYCGKTEGLTDEHIVPFGLGGNWILPQASCIACSRITSDFERKVLRGFMHNARIVAGFQTRRPKQRPKTIPVQTKRGFRFETVDLPITESTGFLQLPVMETGAFLVGKPPVQGVIVKGNQTIAFGKPPKETAAALGTKALQITSNIDVPAFARMLAKIGYCTAVAGRGLYALSEVPVLPYILGTADDGSTWIGSADFRLPVEDNNPTHALGSIILSGMVGKSEETVLVAQVKLFANSGARGYEVVVRRSPK
jgi:hypothetical protein